MATKRYKLVFEVTATKMNLSTVFSMMVGFILSFAFKKGFIEVKVLKKDEEPIKLKPEYLHDFHFFDELIGIKNPNLEILKEHYEK